MNFKITAIKIAKAGFTWKWYNKSHLRIPKPTTEVFCPCQSIIYVILVAPHNPIHKTTLAQEPHTSLEIQLQKILFKLKC